MIRNYSLAPLGLFAMLVTGCTIDAGATTDEPVASVQQRDILQDSQCPDFAEIPNVVVDHELIVNNISVVNDKNVPDPTKEGCRTQWEKPGCPTESKNKWHFWYLMQNLAGTNNVSKFVLKWLESFEETPTVNNQLLMARTKIRPVINLWRQLSGCAFTGTPKVDSDNCQLLPDKAPFRLLAIVNRTDLRVPSSAGSGYGNGRAGEGRIVFGMTNTTTGAPLAATVIFEYQLPVQIFNTNPFGWTPLNWASKWHALGPVTFSPTYNDNLQKITDQFITAGKNLGGTNNGSAISQVRVNEMAFDPRSFTSANDPRQWSLREFKLGCPSGQTCTSNSMYLVNVPVNQTPASNTGGSVAQGGTGTPAYNQNQTTQLDDFLNKNKGTYSPMGTLILGESHIVPDKHTFNGTTFDFRGAESLSNALINTAGSSAFNWQYLNPLTADPTTQDDVRRFFAIGTCNGCHYLETDTNNLHISNRGPTAVSKLSPFLSADPTDTLGGSTTIIPDSNGNPVAFNEPRRRVCEFLNLLHGRSSLVSTTSGRAH